MIGYQKQFSSTEEALVLYERRDQLGARLEGMLSAWRFAKLTRRKLIVFWPDQNFSGQYDPALFFDLKAMVENEDLVIHFSEYNDQFLQGGILDLRKASGWPFFIKKSDYVGSRNHAVKIKTFHSTYFCFRWESPWRVVRELKQLFHQLIPIVQIRDALSEALSWIGDPDFIAVHIRRGDVVDKTRARLTSFISSEAEHGNSPEALEKLMTGGWDGMEIGLQHFLHHFVKKVTSIDSYIAAIPKNNNARVVVFSDSLEAAEEFQARFTGSRSILISSFLVEMTKSQRAYLELLILAKAGRVISTASCFSRVACQCGRPIFHDARNALGADGTRSAFQQLFGDVLNHADFLRDECLRILNRELALDRWVRLPDWLVSIFPPFSWITMK